MLKEEVSDLTLAMLDKLFRGRSLNDGTICILPNGEFLTATELRMLFDSYTAKV